MVRRSSKKRFVGAELSKAPSITQTDLDRQQQMSGGHGQVLLIVVDAGAHMPSESFPIPGFITCSSMR